ncbi:MAG: hypothetical protein NC489_38235 [Ruminococcus flavefaciens]|nr:hypothetical protein [Ruminococcus flavefaciens]
MSTNTYEQAVKEELERQQAAYEAAKAAGNEFAEPPMSEAEARIMYAHLAPTPDLDFAAASMPDLEHAWYRIGDECWSVEACAFAPLPEGVTPIELTNPPTRENLRQTLEFYNLPVGEELLTPEEIIATKRENIDNETSANILAGFDYTINGETFHFSYDAFDQQNFADTANACLMKQAGAEGLPDTITWNAYRHGDGSLARLTLTAEEFLNLYARGALAHKSVCMETGGMKKAAL